MAVTAKKRSALVTVFLPTIIFLACFIGTPIAFALLVENAGGFVIFLGIVLGFILGLVVSVISYKKIYALSEFSEEKIFMCGSSLIMQSGRKEKSIDLSREHISEIESGISPTGSVLTTIAVHGESKPMRIVAMNYEYDQAVQAFPDPRYIGNFPISPFEGLSASELDAAHSEARAFVDELLKMLWEYRQFDAGYRYLTSLPWEEDICPAFSSVRVVQGEAAYRENHTLIEKIKQSAFYTVEESYNYVYINRDYLMICPSKKIDVQLKTRIIPLGVFPMRFIKEFCSAPTGSDHWEYLEIQGMDEKGASHTEMVAFSIFSMNEYYKAKIAKRYLLARNLAQQ